MIRSLDWKKIKEACPEEAERLKGVIEEWQREAVELRKAAFDIISSEGKDRNAIDKFAYDYGRLEGSLEFILNIME